MLRHQLQVRNHSGSSELGEWLYIECMVFSHAAVVTVEDRQCDGQSVSAGRDQPVQLLSKEDPGAARHQWHAHPAAAAGKTSNCTMCEA